VLELNLPTARELQAILGERSKGIQLPAPLRMTLERAIEYIDIDEYVEATPKPLRLRKGILDAVFWTRRHESELPRAA
jgi:GTP-binding protein